MAVSGTEEEEEEEMGGPGADLARERGVVEGRAVARETGESFEGSRILEKGERNSRRGEDDEDILDSELKTSSASGDKHVSSTEFSSTKKASKTL